MLYFELLSQYAISSFHSWISFRIIYTFHSSEDCRSSSLWTDGQMDEWESIMCISNECLNYERTWEPTLWWGEVHFLNETIKSINAADEVTDITITVYFWVHIYLLITHGWCVYCAAADRTLGFSGHSRKIACKINRVILYTSNIISVMC